MHSMIGHLRGHAPPRNIDANALAQCDGFEIAFERGLELIEDAPHESTGRTVPLARTGASRSCSGHWPALVRPAVLTVSETGLDRVASPGAPRCELHRPA